MTAGTLYFIREQDGPIKIGWTTKTVARRLHNLQIGNPRSLSLAASILNVPKAIEADWHVRFAYCRQRGEWFFAVPELLRAIAELTPEAPEEDAPDGTYYPKSAFEFTEKVVLPLGQWMSDNKVTQTALARMAGIDRTILSRSLRGRIPMSLATARRIEIACEGAVKASTLLGLGEAA